MDHWKYAKHFDQLAVRRDLLAQQERIESLLPSFISEHNLIYTLAIFSRPWRLVLCLTTKSKRLADVKQSIIRKFVASLATPDNNLFVQEIKGNDSTHQLAFNLHLNDTQRYLSYHSAR